MGRAMRYRDLRRHTITIEDTLNKNVGSPGNAALLMTLWLWREYNEGRDVTDRRSTQMRSKNQSVPILATAVKKQLCNLRN